MSDLAVGDLRTLWVDLPEDPFRARDVLLEATPALTTTYGDVSATVAAEFYEEMRREANVSGRAWARLAPATARDAVVINTRWAVGPLFDDDRPGAFGRVRQVVDRAVLQPGRETIDLSVRADPAKPRWARVPTGPSTCAFCLMLASRGAVYGSREAAGGGGNEYHADCYCTPTPIWPSSSLPTGYDPEALLDRYQAARAAAGTGDSKAVLSELRRLEGIH